RLTGLVVGVREAGPGDDALKAVLDVLDDAPAFTPELLRLTKWMADYYVCGWGEVVKAALPTGTDVESEHRVVATGAAEGAPGLPPRARAVLRCLARRPAPTVSARRQQGGDVPLALLRRLERDGLLRLELETTAPKVSVRYERHLRFAPAFRHGGAAKDLAAQLRGGKQVAVVETLAGFALVGEREPRQADVLARAEASAATVASLVAKGIVEVVEKEVFRSPLGDLPVAAGPPPERPLHPAQARALERVGAAVEAGRFEAF